MKKILVTFILLIIVGISIFIYKNQFLLGMLIGDLFRIKYEFHYIYSPKKENCVTVTTYYHTGGFPDAHYYRYITFGKNKYKWPPAVKSIQFLNESDFIIFWEDDKLLKIITEVNPSKLDNLSNDFQTELLYFPNKHYYHNNHEGWIRDTRFIKLSNRYEKYKINSREPNEKI